MSTPAMGYCADCKSDGTGAHFKTGIDRLCCPLLYPDGIDVNILNESVQCPKFVERTDENYVNDEAEPEDTTDKE